MRLSGSVVATTGSDTSVPATDHGAYHPSNRSSDPPGSLATLGSDV
jgi:hypothetical protein